MSPLRFGHAFVLVLLAAPIMASAQVAPDEHASRHPAQQTNEPGSSSKIASDAASIKDVQAEREKMHALMDKIQHTDDAAERKMLLEQHRKMMHQELHAMGQMKCPMMGTPGPNQAGKSDGKLMECHQMMETRMEMTTALLEQMLEHEEAER